MSSPDPFNISRYCQLSYHAGTRFNPEEVTFKGRKGNIGGAKGDNKAAPAKGKADPQQQPQKATDAVRKKSVVMVVTEQPRRQQPKGKKVTRR